jgi:hypothetical protein
MSNSACFRSNGLHNDSQRQALKFSLTRSGLLASGVIRHRLDVDTPTWKRVDSRAV